VGAPVAAVSAPRSPTWPYESFDAREWAAAFLEFHPQYGVDYELLVGWFANALMRGYDEHAARRRSWRHRWRHPLDRSTASRPTR
jgi:hypothetical protein